MTSTAPRTPAAEPAPAVPAARETAPAPAPVADPPPSAGRGRTAIADQVVGKIAGMAAREVYGVHSFGAGLTRALGAVRDRVPGGRSSGSVTRGVKVEVGEKQAAVDLDLVVEYGVSIAEVAADVREEVIGAVERMTGLQVVEVNVNVVDVHLPDEDEDGGDPDATRVR
ncbi:Asp23/Gls24 family envelope stress response protein [Kitasatospora phosalacinea]|uniref:Asp23/Gls24 family envelope stress response protein n=1 Tax=Kitasatospora phosalacinea TaxID=2065 RepID=UPI003646F407